MTTRRRLPFVVLGVFLLLLGGVVIGAGAFVDSVQLVGQVQLPATTSVLYSNGDVLATLGQETRYELQYDDINPNIINAVIAAEDDTFWQNNGIDLTGVARAAWNNFLGHDIQGGSTISQQYARMAYELSGVTYQRKAREAVLAWKMNRSMSKPEILAAYLNSVPFGRQAYGVEAAAKAFLGKSASLSVPADQQLTLPEAMALAEMIKQPNPDPDDPEGKPGYDPTISAAAQDNAQARFDYVRGRLVAMGTISSDDAAALQYPLDSIRPDTDSGNGTDTPAGMVVNHALSEITHTPGSQFYGAKDWTAIKNGGYQIHTTIDHNAQDVAEHMAGGTADNSPMVGLSDNVQAALVAVQPGTGRVLAYYGGPDGNGADYAGNYIDANGDVNGAGAHPAGSSFKVYTLAAALKAGYSLNSYWDWNPHDMPGRTGSNQVTNASNCGSLKSGDKTPCSLLQSTISSLNVPFYAVTYSVGPANVLQMAKSAGITTMWTDDLEARDLADETDMNNEYPQYFDTELGIGQYPITVLDHANGIATFAADGLPATAHFVTSVTKGDQTYYTETLPDPTTPRVMSQQNINDLDYALSQVGSAKLTDFPLATAGKTGTWEFGPNPVQNAHAWMVGYDHQLAVAVWVGNKADEQPLEEANGSEMYGSGTPAKIWQLFMRDATTRMGAQTTYTQFNKPNYGGDTNPPGSVPSPTPTHDQPTDCPTILPGIPNVFECNTNTRNGRN